MQVQDVPFFRVPFFEQKIYFGISFLVKSQVIINFGVSFLVKSQVVINFGVSFLVNKFWGVILEKISLGY